MAEKHLGTTIKHVHINTKEPVATARCYVVSFSGHRTGDPWPRSAGRPARPALNGIAPIMEQDHEQHFGIGHNVLAVDDHRRTLSKLKANGVEMFDALPPNTGRPVRFYAATDSARDRADR